MGKIDHPEYYKAGGIEAIDVIEDWKLDFCLGNAIKYIARAGKKSDDVKTDLEKAAWYIKRHKRGIERGILKKIPPKPTIFLPANLNSAWDLGFPLWSVISRIYDAPRLDKRSGVTYLNSISRAIECLRACINCLPQETDVKRKEENKKMSDYANYMDYILNKLDERTLLEQLAEEASELSQAALKLIRAKGLSENVTPKTEDGVMQNLAEEMMDCSIVMALLSLKDKKIRTAVHHSEGVSENLKWKRWAERLGYEEKK